jgi:hypothetical protein
MLELAPPADDTTSGDSSSRVAAMPDTELYALYEECRRRERIAAAQGAIALAEIDRRRSFVRLGYLSVAAQTGDSHRVAAGRVRVARALQEMPLTAAAFSEGDIDPSRVHRLVDAKETATEAFAEAEPSLVGRARAQDAKTFAKAVELWRQNTMGREAARREESRRWQRRHLTISATFEGMVHLDADLDPVTGETVLTAIRAVAGPADRDGGDGRTPTQRRVDALGEICRRRYLDSGDAPISGGRKPHLNVIVDLDALAGGPAGRSEIGDRRPLGPAARELLACDATVCGVIMQSGYEVLRMGRTARTATPAQLRALAIRDGGCVIPGCDRPPDWCDAHHLVPWTHGGLTDIANLGLVCRPHHMDIHYGLVDFPQRE